MSMNGGSFPVDIDFRRILQTISEQIYETPLAFIRENVQNAVDAVRIQAALDGVDPSDNRYAVSVAVDGAKIRVRDNGNGMTPEDMRRYFWRIGASGKRTPAAIAAGCVGKFGIGGFANFGVCHTVEVISQVPAAGRGTYTRLSEEDIRASGATRPQVTVHESDLAAPRGTLVIGHLKGPANGDELRRYLSGFVRFVPVAVTFNGDSISQEVFTSISDRDNYSPIDEQMRQWRDGDLVVSGRLYEDRGHKIAAAIHSLGVAGEMVRLVGQLRFETGALDIYKQGFKLCATSVGTTIGVSGRLDCATFAPTAGRDSLDAPTNTLVSRIALALEKAAVATILGSADRIRHNPRIFRYVIQRGMLSSLANVPVRLADGSEDRLGAIRQKAAGGVSVFFGRAQKQALNQIMQARGHVVVVLPAHHYRRRAEREYLTKFCGAEAFDGVIECQEHYEELSRFERVFLSELEFNVAKAYELERFRVLAGRLTEDVPVYVKDSKDRAPTIYVDVRHPEIVKLKVLGYGELLYSLIGTFCREYLGQALKRWSPRFFGDGALNLDLLAKRRSEFWLLVRDDIGIVARGGHPDIVTRAKLVTVTVGSEGERREEDGDHKPRILRIVEQYTHTGVAGYYIRLPDSGFAAYGDLLPECDNRGVHWGGNKIQYVVSDARSAAFQYEIRLDEVVVTEEEGRVEGQGATGLDRPLQEMYGGLYFPIPSSLERYLVPKGNEEIRIRLTCEWFDVRTGKHWRPMEREA